jgi:hypothetical protein
LELNDDDQIALAKLAAEANGAINQRLARKGIEERIEDGAVPFQFNAISVTNFPRRLINVRQLLETVGSNYDILVGEEFVLKRKDVREYEFSRTHCIVILVLLLTLSMVAVRIFILCS